MSKYPYIMAAFLEERWAIQQSKLQIILDFMSDQAAGIKYDQTDILARTGARARGGSDGIDTSGAVAILPLRGVISNRMSMMGDISGGTSSEAFGNSFKMLLASDEVKAIIIDVDSPGGAVSGTDELSSLIYASRGKKPIVAHVNATAASAAYWIASAADEIVVTPSGSVGSIGVLMIHEDVSGAMEKAGVRKTIIKAGEYKYDGHPYSPLPDDVRSRIQGRINAAYDVFIGAVARNRGVDASTVRGGFGKGDMVDARPAVAAGMADRAGTLQETIDRLSRSKFAVRPRPRAAAPLRDAYKAELQQFDQAEVSRRADEAHRLRAEIEGPPVLFRLTGLAAPYNQVASVEHHGRMEYAPGCFKTLNGVPLLFDHDFSKSIGQAGRMSLTEGKGGIRLSCDIHADRQGFEAVEAYLSGYTSMSIASNVRASTPSATKGAKRVTDAQLLEVSLVSTGAFKGTSATLQPVAGLTMEEALAKLKRDARAVV